MALGTINLSTDGVLTGKIEWSSTSNGSVANSSTITAIIYARRTDSYTTYGKDWGGYVNIGGSGTSISFGSSVSVGSSWVEMARTTKTIEHNDNGTLSVYIDGRINGCQGTSLDGRTSSGGKSVDMDFIARATEIGNVSGTIGENITISWSKKASSFTHTLEYSIDGGNTRRTIGTGLVDSKVWKPDLSIINEITDDNKRIGTIYLTTYNGSQKIGEKNAVLTLLIPDSVVPTINESESTFVDAITSLSSFGFVQTKSYLKAHISASGVRGSTIKSYMIQTTDGNITENDGTLSKPISTYGDYVITYYVVDSRNRKSAVKTKTISVKKYASPVISTFSVERDSSNPATLNMTIKGELYRLDNANTKVATIYYKKKTESISDLHSMSLTSSLTQDGLLWKIDGTFTLSTDADYSYDVSFRLSDSFDKAQKDAEIGTSFVLMDFLNDGTGISFGQVASESNTISIGNNMTFKYHGQEIGSPNVLEAINTRGNVTDANITHTYENNKMHLKLLPSTSSMTSNKPNVQSTTADGYIMDFQWDTSGDWRGQLFISGGFRGEATNKNSNQCLQMRFCNNGTWSSWQSVGLTAYPVGSIYISTSSTSPASLFGGSWTQITNRFLYATTTSNTTGGASTHRHDFKIGHIMNWLEIIADNYSGQGAWSYSQKKYSKSYGAESSVSTSTNGGHQQTGGSNVTESIRYSVGDTDTASSMPPYYTVYCWRRTA